MHWDKKSLEGVRGGEQAGSLVPRKREGWDEGVTHICAFWGDLRTKTGFLIIKDVPEELFVMAKGPLLSPSKDSILTPFTWDCRMGL